MNNKKVYYTSDCIKLIKKKYPYIPKWVIRRVLFGEDLYMHKVGIISWTPKFSDWTYNKRS